MNKIKLTIKHWCKIKLLDWIALLFHTRRSLLNLKLFLVLQEPLKL